jgi:DNA-binding response OmpR family regulator
MRIGRARAATNNSVPVLELRAQVLPVSLREAFSDLPPNLAEARRLLPPIEFERWIECAQSGEAPSAEIVLLDGRAVRPSLLLRVVRRTRAAWDGPIVILFELEGLSVWPAAQTLGATDFVTSANAAAEVSARLNSRKATLAVAPRNEGLHIDWRQLELVAGSTRIKLTLREIQLIDVLMKASEPMGAAELARAAWGGESGAYAASTHICAIRKKLASFGGDLGIRTMPAKGYVFLQLKPDANSI